VSLKDRKANARVGDLLISLAGNASLKGNA